MTAAECQRRLATMVANHGEWVRTFYASRPDVPHCDCSRCRMPSPTRVVRDLGGLA